MIKRDIVYSYDGTLDGFLTCVFESFTHKEEPFDIVCEQSPQPTLLPTQTIKTDIQKSQRVFNSIIPKMGQEIFEFIQDAFLTCLSQKEIHLLRFMVLGYKHKEKALKMLANDDVLILSKAVNFLLGEAHLLKGFIRFVSYGGVLAATISPKNKVLPIIAPHFIDRLPNEKFLIYDDTNKMICAYANKKCAIYETDDFVMPQKTATELDYQQMWKKFYDTISIKPRLNPKLRQGLMPKRYWKNISELN